MGDKETLRSYNGWYWETFNQIGDCPTNLVIAQYKRGLPVRNKLRDSITMTPPLTIEALMERVHQHIRVEKDSAQAKAKSGSTVMPDKKTAAKVNTVKQPNRNGRSRRAYREDPEKKRLRVRTAITTVFNKPIYQILNKIKNEPFVRQPAKLGIAQRGYDERSRCTFHDEKGHLTENCAPLRQHLEELVAAVEPYHPEKVLKQFGKVQTIPPAPLDPVRAIRGVTAGQYRRIDHALRIAHLIIEAGYDASVREPYRLNEAIERIACVLQDQQIDEA
ncbi:uncharacterized protein LOC114266350 [Camellia sinensis]|uniref:uncharacterized protein LOC114266350 n=1 Tax=Camellia sinensis TaxID=4442 RepID=UPI00103680BB|nr:uncharacterized protein LOC114266350 [Camellia sinensis]